MLELTDLILIVGFNIVLSFLFAVLFALVLRWLLDYKILERLRSCEMVVKNSKMQDVKLDKKQKMNLAILRAKELHEEGKKPIEIASAIAVEYPDVAFDAIRQLQKLAGDVGVSLE